MLSERFLKAFEASRAFPEFSPPQYGWDASFFRSGSGEGLSEPVMEFSAMLGAFLILSLQTLPQIAIEDNKLYARALRIVFR